MVESEIGRERVEFSSAVFSHNYSLIKSGHSGLLAGHRYCDNLVFLLLLI